MLPSLAADAAMEGIFSVGLAAFGECACVALEVLLGRGRPSSGDASR
jgi:hypothetical protein